MSSVATTTIDQLHGTGTWQLEPAHGIAGFPMGAGQRLAETASIGRGQAAT